MLHNVRQLLALSHTPDIAQQLSKGEGAVGVRLLKYRSGLQLVTDDCSLEIALMQGL